MASVTTAPRKATNVSLAPDLLAEAKTLDVNISRACEKGLKAEVKAERERRWRDDNAGAIAWWNDYVDRHGVPLAKYRQF